MKKLFLALILSLFSIHVYAGSCPDGSDPVKSISDDGTYFVYNCSGGNEQASSSTAKSLKFELDTENGKLEDYSYITDPTGNFNKVHKFTTGSECGSKTRDIDWDNMVGEMETSDCGENSVRSQMVEQVWEDNRPGDIQPKYQWYSWDVYLPEDFPIQDSGKLLLGEFHNGECAHISFTSQGGDDKGVLNFTTMKLWDGDCKDTSRIPITKIQDMRGKWTNFQLEVKWENNETGLANLWLNGKQVLAYKGRTLTLQKENLNFMLIGLYQCCNDRDKVIKPAMAYFTTPKASMNSITPVYEDLDLTSIPKNILSKGNTQSLWNAYQTASECFMHPTYGEGFGYQLKKISQNDFKKNEWITPFFTLDESRKHEIQLTGKTLKPIVTVKLNETYGEENAEVNRARKFFKNAAYVARIGNSDLEVQKVKTVLLDWAKNDALKEGINVSWGDKPVDWQMMMLINAILTTTATIGENINAEERQIIGPWLNGLVQKVAKSNWKDRQDNKAYLTSYMTLIWGLMVNDLNAVQNSIDVVKLAVHDMRPDGSLPIDTQRSGMGIKYNSDSFAYLLMMASILRDVTGKDLFLYKADGRSLLNGVNFVIKSVKAPSKTNSMYAISCPGAGDRWGSIKNPSKYHIESSTYLLVYAYKFPNDENSDYLINKYGGTFNQPKLRIRSKPSGVFTLHPMLISSKSELFHSQTGEVKAEEKEDIAAIPVTEKSSTYDGSYAFIIRTEPDDGEKNIGTAQFIIKDGKISVARKYRYLLTSAISSYDTFEGIINKEGKINASFEVNPIRHMVEPKTIQFSGSMESLQLLGRFDKIKSWDNNTKEYVLDENFYPYDVIIDFKKEKY